MSISKTFSFNDSRTSDVLIDNVNFSVENAPVMFYDTNVYKILDNLDDKITDITLYFYNKRSCGEPNIELYKYHNDKFIVLINTHLCTTHDEYCIITSQACTITLNHHTYKWHPLGGNDWPRECYIMTSTYKDCEYKDTYISKQLEYLNFTKEQLEHLTDGNIIIIQSENNEVVINVHKRFECNLCFNDDCKLDKIKLRNKQIDVYEEDILTLYKDESEKPMEAFIKSLISNHL